MCWPARRGTLRQRKRSGEGGSVAVVVVIGVVAVVRHLCVVTGEEVSMGGSTGVSSAKLRRRVAERWLMGRGEARSGCCWMMGMQNAKQAHE